MNIQDFTSMVVLFVQENRVWAAPVVFMLAFGESLAFLSLVLPATAILALLGGLIGASGIDFWPVWWAGGVGSVLGYALSYWIGLYFKDSINTMWPFRSNPELLARGKTFFEKYGVFGVFLGHFFGPVRAVIPVVAGMYAMPQIPFQIANVASSFLWATGVMAPGVFGVKWLSGI